MKEEILQAVETKVNEAVEQFQDGIEAVKTGAVSKDELDAKFKEVSNIVNELKDSEEFKAVSLIEEQIKAMTEEQKAQTEALKTQGETLRELMEKGGTPGAQQSEFVSKFKAKWIESGIAEEYENEHGEKCVRMKEGAIPKGGVSIELGNLDLKAAISMTTALALTPGATPGTNIGYLTDYAMQPVKLPISQDTHLMTVFPVKNTTNKYFGVVVYYTETDGTDVKAENTALGSSSFKIKTVEYFFHDLGAKYHVSKNNLEDVDGMLSEIEARATNNILKKFDTEALSTNATPSTAIVGLLGSGYYTDFDPSTWASSVPDANVIDVIKKMKLQARKSDYGVNAVILSPDLIDELESLKDADNNYLKSLGVVFDANGNISRVGGLAVIDNSNVPYTAGGAKYAIAVNPMESAEIGLRKDVTMEIGWENDDLGKCMVTIIFYARIAFGIKDTNTIIVSDDVDADIAVLDKAVA